MGSELHRGSTGHQKPRKGSQMPGACGGMGKNYGWGTEPVCDLVGVGLHPHLTRVWLAPKAVTYGKATVTDNKCVTAQLPMHIKFLGTPDPQSASAWQHLPLLLIVCRIVFAFSQVTP